MIRASRVRIHVSKNLALVSSLGVTKRPGSGNAKRLDGDSTKADWSTALSAAFQAGIENGASGPSKGENLSRPPDWEGRGLEA